MLRPNACTRTSKRSADWPRDRHAYTGIMDGRRWRSANEKVQVQLITIDKQLAGRPSNAALIAGRLPLTPRRRSERCR